MENTFCRPRKIEIARLDAIIEKLEADLMTLLSGNATEQDAVRYSEKFVRQGKRLPKNRKMIFWGFDKPENMPSDCRVDFFYWPTYLVVCFLVNVQLQFPESARKIDGFAETLAGGLLAATGRGFEGSGLDSEDGFFHAMSLFLKSNIPTFLRQEPMVSPEFSTQFSKAMEALHGFAAGKLVSFCGYDLSEEAEKVLAVNREANI